MFQLPFCDDLRREEEQAAARERFRAASAGAIAQ
jgi:hypothetical protein